MKPLGLYVHIPFCVRKCGYCDFLSMPAGEDEHGRYIEALLKEIRGFEEKFRCNGNDYEVGTVYIGGGTPSVIKPAYIGEILGCIREVFTVKGDEEREMFIPEITIEVNPGTVTREKLGIYRESGINRLSIGLQSACNRELEALGRIHTYEEFERTYYSAREAGFTNINIDIMTAIPLQTMESLEHTIDKTVSLLPPPEHISAYSLILEEGTPFYERYAEGGESDILPDEEEERSMYHFTVERLKECGYHRYEISNFARPGFESRHNSSYWRRTDYLGFGLGASSLINDTRYRNTADPEKYIAAPESCDDFAEVIGLSPQERMEEFMFLGLRMTDGVAEEEFLKCFGIPVRQCYGAELDRLAREGLIKEEKGRISLTEKGVDYGNYVFSRFIRN